MAQTQIKCQQEQLSGVLEGRETSLCCGQRMFKSVFNFTSFRLNRTLLQGCCKSKSKSFIILLYFNTLAKQPTAAIATNLTENM